MSRPHRGPRAALLAMLLTAASPAAAAASDALFDPSMVRDLWVLMNARDWATLRANSSENTYYPCDVEWEGLRVRNAGCRSRGTGSRNGVKPGLRLDFNHYVQGQAFLGLRAVVLDNFWQDPSMMRESLAMHLLERMGLPVPRQAYIRLYVGAAREFAGLYAVVEEIDDGYLERRFDAHTGLLYEYRWRDEYRFEDLGEDLAQYAARFEPRTHEGDSMFTLYQPIRELVLAVNDMAAGGVEAALAPYLDVETLLVQLAAENYLAEWDGLLGYAGLDNFYLYRFPDTGRFQLLAWDKDNTFSWLQMPPSHNFEENVLTRKIWADPALRVRYLRLLLRAADAGAGLAEAAARGYELIRQAAEDDPLKPFSNEQFADAAGDLYRFAGARGAVVRALVRPLLSAAGVGAGVAGAR